MTAFSSVVYKKLPPPEAASLSQTAPKTSRKKAKSFPPAKAAPTTKGKPSLSLLKKATASCSASIPAPRSRLMAKISSS